jgi:hypothetical protein
VRDLQAPLPLAWGDNRLYIGMMSSAMQGFRRIDNVVFVLNNGEGQG